MDVFYRNQLYRCEDPEELIKCHGNRYLMKICNVHQYYAPLVISADSKYIIPEFHRDLFLIADFESNYYKFYSDYPLPVYTLKNHFPLITETVVGNRDYKVLMDSNLTDPNTSDRELMASGSSGIIYDYVKVRDIMQKNIAEIDDNKDMSMEDLITIKYSNKNMLDLNGLPSLINYDQTKNIHCLFKINSLPPIEAYLFLALPQNYWNRNASNSANVSSRKMSRKRAYDHDSRSNDCIQFRPNATIASRICPQCLSDPHIYVTPSQCKLPSNVNQILKDQNREFLDKLFEEYGVDQMRHSLFNKDRREDENLYDARNSSQIVLNQRNLNLFNQTHQINHNQTNGIRNTNFGTYTNPIIHGNHGNQNNLGFLNQLNNVNHVNNNYLNNRQQNHGPNIRGQNYRPNSAGQHYGLNIRGQNYRPNTGGQSYGLNNGGLIYGSDNGGYNYGRSF